MIHPFPWQSAPWPDMVDAIICDPPYSERTHSGNNGGRRNPRYGTSAPIGQLDYASLTPADVQAWAAAWAPRVRHWCAVMTDHTLIHAWYDSFEAAGLYAFAPVPCTITGMTCRLAGDGPSSWAVYLMVARPRTREAAKWRTLPGGYWVGQSIEHGQRGHMRPNEARVGGKPLSLMQQIVRDYSNPGHLVADPCAGGGTTLVAAKAAGRQIWGAECDPVWAARAQAAVDAVQVAEWLDVPTPVQSTLL